MYKVACWSQLPTIGIGYNLELSALFIELSILLKKMAQSMPSSFFTLRNGLSYKLQNHLIDQEDRF